MDPAALTPRAGPQQQPHCSPLGVPVSPDTAQPHTGHLPLQPGDRTTVAVRFSPRSTPISSKKLRRGKNLEENWSQSCPALPQVPWLPRQHHHNGVRVVPRDGPSKELLGPQITQTKGVSVPQSRAPALKLQHLPGCVSTARGNPHLELSHNLAFKAFCSNRGSQGFTIPSSASGLGLLLTPHADFWPSSLVFICFIHKETITTSLPPLLASRAAMVGAAKLGKDPGDRDMLGG